MMETRRGSEEGFAGRMRSGRSSRSRKIVDSSTPTSLPSHLLLSSIAAIVICGSTFVNGNGCDHFVLLPAAEECQGKLEDTTKDALHGDLTRQNKEAACELYKDTTQCLDSLINRCPQQAEDFGIPKMREKPLNGVGRLCESTSEFESYLEHVRCYKQQRYNTEKCMSEFHENITKVEDEDSQTRLCGILNRLFECVEVDYFQTTCGLAAANLFRNLIAAQVPTHIITYCEIPTVAPAGGANNVNFPSIVHYLFICFLAKLIKM